MVCYLLVVVSASISGPARDLFIRFEDFDTDPHWEGYRNHLLPDPLPITRQEFGRCSYHREPAIGGWVQRSLTPAWFAKPVPVRTLKDKLFASGKFAITNDLGSSGLLFGWFNSSSRGWRTPNSLVFRIDGNGGRYWVFYEYGTAHWLTGGGGCFEGKRYQTTKTKPFAADGSIHVWSLSYDPEAGAGDGQLTFVIDGAVYNARLLPGHKQDDAEFNRFGLFNLQTTGNGMEAYFTDLVLNGEQIDLRNVADWEGVGNKTQFQDRHLRPYHDFGWKPVAAAGANSGILGGIIWRDETPAYYARDVGTLGLDDELMASGQISFESAGSDSGVYLGWFNSQSKTNKQASDHEQPQQNFLAILIEGPSRIGHYFRPRYATATGQGELPESGPIIRPDHRVHQWSIHYLPQAGHGDGEIRVKLDETSQILPLKPEYRKQGASFDRFGLFNLQVGGHFVEIAVDDLKFSSFREAKN